MASGEIYPNAPLVSVAFELRHPITTGIGSVEQGRLRELLRDRFPVMRMQQQMNQLIEFGPSGPVTRSDAQQVPRFFNRDTTSAISLLPGSTVVETTDYRGWGDFVTVIEMALRARHEVSPIVGVERVGLRYVDEVRVPDSALSDWSEWIHPSLSAPSGLASIPLPLSTWQGAVMYGAEPGDALVLRYGPALGFATDPNGELRRRNAPAPGPFFLIDVDSFHSSDGVPAFTIEETLVTANGLHAPVRIAFESSITEKYREDILR